MQCLLLTCFAQCSCVIRYDEWGCSRSKYNPDHHHCSINVRSWVTYIMLEDLFSILFIVNFMKITMVLFSVDINKNKLLIIIIIIIIIAVIIIIIDIIITTLNYRYQAKALGRAGSEEELRRDQQLPRGRSTSC